MGTQIFQNLVPERFSLQPQSLLLGLCRRYWKKGTRSYISSSVARWWLDLTLLQRTPWLGEGNTCSCNRMLHINIKHNEKLYFKKRSRNEIIQETKRDASWKQLSKGICIHYAVCPTTNKFMLLRVRVEWLQSNLWTLLKNIFYIKTFQFLLIAYIFHTWRRGRDRMVVGFTTTYAISAYHHWCCEFEHQSGWGVQH
jgi:hypothetical protein